MFRVGCGLLLLSIAEWEDMCVCVCVCVCVCIRRNPLVTRLSSLLGSRKVFFSFVFAHLLARRKTRQARPPRLNNAGGGGGRR